MSLALFMAVVVRLHADGKVAVPQLATALAVPEERVVDVLRDVRAQGHCTLWHDARGHVTGAQWQESAACA